MASLCRAVHGFVSLELELCRGSALQSLDNTDTAVFWSLLGPALEVANAQTRNRSDRSPLLEC